MKSIAAILKHSITVSLFIIVFPFLSFSQPSVTWEKIIDGYKVNSTYETRALTSDINGDFIITGIKDSAVFYTMFLKKMHQDGSEIFNLTDSSIYPYSITTDIHGNIYVGGMADAGTPTHTKIIKYDSSGNFKWKVIDPLFINSIMTMNMSCDSLGNIYFGLGYQNGSGSSVVMGKIDSTGYIIRSSLQTGLYGFQYLKVQSNQRFVAVYSSSYSVHVSLRDSTSAIVATHQENNMDIECSAVLDDNGALFLVGRTNIFDSTIVTKLDNSLITTWRTSLANATWTTKPLLDYFPTGLYVFLFENTSTLYSFNTTGNVIWQKIISINGMGTGNLDCDNLGNVYAVADSFLTSTASRSILKQYDSSGNLKGTKTINGYYRHLTSLNLSDRYFIFYDSQQPNAHGFYLFGCDSSITDTLSVQYENFQSNEDKGLTLKKDYNGDLICITLVTDTIQYLNTYTFTNNIEIFKYDISGNLIWRTRVHVYENPGVFDVNIDIMNNIYVCGTVNISQYNTAGFAFKVSSSGQEMWQYLMHNPAFPGNNNGTSITTDNNLNVYFGGAADSTHGNTSAFISKLDPAGVTQWVKYIHPDPDSSERINCLVHRNNHIYAVQMTNFQGHANYFINDLDTSGNLIRKLSFNHGQNATINDLLIDNNNNFYCHGSCYTPISSLYLVKFDSLGSVAGEWRDSVSGTLSFGAEDAVIDSSGNIFLTGSNYINGHANCINVGFDSNINLMWVDSTNNNRGSNIDFVDGVVYATAMGSVTDSGFVIGYDIIGAQLFKVYLPKYANYFFHYDIIAETNAFYILGTIRSDTSANDILFRKYGALNLSIAKGPHSNQDLVYPNPSSSRFNIIASGEYDDLEIYNCLGEIIYSRNVARNYPIEINLESRPEGIYYYVLLSGGIKKAEGKLVKMTPY